jgi:hypothetical protein
MPDQEKCTRTTAPPYSPPPPPPEPPEPPEEPEDNGDHLFRHTFLWRLTDPKDREAMLQLARGFDSCLCEMGCWGEDDSRMLPSMAGALADDVEALGAYALTVARVGEESQIEPGDAGIIHFAPQWAERLAHIAVEMRIVVSAARGAA